jgi:hypothetical protein
LDNQSFFIKRLLDNNNKSCILFSSDLVEDLFLVFIKNDFIAFFRNFDDKIIQSLNKIGCNDNFPEKILYLYLINNNILINHDSKIVNRTNIIFNFNADKYKRSELIYQVENYIKYMINTNNKIIFELPNNEKIFIDLTNLDDKYKVNLINFKFIDFVLFVAPDEFNIDDFRKLILSYFKIN